MLWPIIHDLLQLANILWGHSISETKNRYDQVQCIIISRLTFIMSNVLYVCVYVYTNAGSHGDQKRDFRFPGAGVPVSHQSVCVDAKIGQQPLYKLSHNFQLLFHLSKPWYLKFENNLKLYLLKNVSKSGSWDNSHF